MAGAAIETGLRMSYEEYLAFIKAQEIAHSEWEDGEETVFKPPTSRHDHFVVF